MYFIIRLLPLLLLVLDLFALVVLMAYSSIAFATGVIDTKVIFISLSFALASTAVLVLGDYNTETFYPHEYDVARMAEAYDAKVVSGPGEQLVHYHWFGDYWVYTVESASTSTSDYAEYVINTSVNE